eukprot:2179766-Ditylum_brightwellii.AAC.1
MLDPRTSILYKRQDVIWLGEMFFQKKPSYEDDEDEALLPWPETIDPESKQLITIVQDDNKETEEAKSNNEDKNEAEEMLSASKGEREREMRHQILHQH